MQKERSLVIIKPDGVQRTLIGEVIKRIERIGLKLVGLKMIIPNKEMVRNHYLADPEWINIVGRKNLESQTEKTDFTDQEIKEAGEKILERLIKYMISGPVVVMVWQGAHSVSVIRKVVGGTEPRTSDVGTIRGDFVMDSYQMADNDQRSVRNIIHASGSPEEANKEIENWFNESELLNYRLIQEQILYDVNLDGILE